MPGQKGTRGVPATPEVKTANSYESATRLPSEGSHPHFAVGEVRILKADRTSVDDFDSIVSRARIRFLAVALCNTVLPAFVGIIVYHVTHSLTIEVDFASSSCAALSLILNITVEFLKKGQCNRGGHSGKSVLLLDFAGGFISMALLLGVAIFGVRNATNRVAKMDESERVGHVGLMLVYNCFSVLLDMFTLAFWWKSRDLLSPPTTRQRQDQLNVNSGLLLSIVDFMRGLSVTGTSFWMLYINMKGETALMELKDKVRGDVFGSFLLCACVLISASFLLKESIDTLHRIVTNDSKVEDRMLTKGNDYGSLKGSAV